MNMHDKLHLLSRSGIKVQPTIKNNKFAVQIIDEKNKVYKKKINTGDYKHNTNTINEAIISTINFIVAKINR